MYRFAVLLIASFSIASAHAQEGPCVPAELSPGDARHLVLIETFRDTDSEIRDVRFSPDGRLLAAAANDGQARIWDIETGRVVMRTQQFDSPIWHAGFSTDSRRLLIFVAGMGPSHLYVWDVAGGEGRPTEDLTISPDLMIAEGYRATSLDGTRSYEPGRGLYDPQTQADIAPIRSGIGNATPLFSRDSNVFVIGAPYESRVFDARSGALAVRLCDTSNEVVPRLSADGRFLASAESFSLDVLSVAIWDTRGGALLTRLVAPKGSVWALDISPDGQLLATGSTDGSVRIWRIALGAGEVAEIVDADDDSRSASGVMIGLNWVNAIPFAILLFALVLVIGLLQRRLGKRN